MLSKFGIALRKVRLDKQILLKDMANDLQVTSAFLSSVETGRRKIPNGWINKICELYSLSDDERDSLEMAKAKTEQEIRIPISSSTDMQKDLAFSLAKALDGLSDADVERIMNAMNNPKRGANKHDSKSNRKNRSR
ncbi:MAG: helix-turn-helix domain-containing protein [Oscillibacter sp.]|nr:helix-turn-helix domain-containing protein [Oscillibacter sp.]